jgi:hypothetical protein
MQATPFRPSRNGFPFPNAFACPSAVLGLAQPPLPGFGLAAGMCWAALDRYFMQRRIERNMDRPANGDALHMELLLRHANALARARWDEISAWQQLPDTARLGNPGLGELSRLEWRRVRASLDAGRPILLMLIRAAGRYANPTENSFVLAYRYTLEAKPARAVVWLYDPNRPNDDDLRMAFSLRPRQAPLAATLGTHGAVRGFFAVDYDRALPPALRWEPASPVQAGRLVCAPAVVARGSEIHLFGPDERGHLLQVTWSPEGRARSTDVSARARGGVARALVGTPAVFPGELRVVARARNGELVEARRRAALGWRIRTVSGRGAGTGLLIDTDPVLHAGARGVWSVFALSGGDLVHFQWSRWGGWSSVNLSTELGIERGRLAGRPAALSGPGRSQHVFVRTREGQLYHFHRAPGIAWRAIAVSAEAGASERLTMVDDPVPLLAGDGSTLHVFSRGINGGFAHVRRGSGRPWRPGGLASDAAGERTPRIASQPVPLVAPDGTTHLFARGTEGGLIHVWSAGDGHWRGSDVTGSRSVIGAAFTFHGAPRVCTSNDGSFSMFARRDGELLHYRWHEGSDWIAENVTRERAGGGGGLAFDPLLIPRDGATRLVALDRAGAIRSLLLQLSAAESLWQRGARHVVRGVGLAGRIPAAMLTTLRAGLRTLASLPARAWVALRRPAAPAANPPAPVRKAPPAARSAQPAAGPAPAAASMPNARPAAGNSRTDPRRANGTASAQQAAAGAAAPADTGRSRTGSAEPGAARRPPPVQALPSAGAGSSPPRVPPLPVAIPTVVTKRPGAPPVSAQEPPRRRSVLPPEENPALKGLPLMDLDKPAAPAQPRPLADIEAGGGGPTPAAEPDKPRAAAQSKRRDALLEMRRIMRLGEQVQTVAPSKDLSRSD